MYQANKHEDQTGKLRAASWDEKTDHFRGPPPSWFLFASDTGGSHPVHLQWGGHCLSLSLSISVLSLSLSCSLSLSLSHTHSLPTSILTKLHSIQLGLSYRPEPHLVGLGSENPCFSHGFFAHPVLFNWMLGFLVFFFFWFGCFCFCFYFYFYKLAILFTQ